MSIAYLKRRVTLCASHRLHSSDLSDEENRRIFDKCNRPNGHGHNYSIEVTLRGEVDPKTGMIMNLIDLNDILERTVVSEMDHKHLNLDVPFFANLNPTAENIAITVWKLVEPHLPSKVLYEVTVQETENNEAKYRGE